MFRTYPNGWPRAVPLAVSLLALWSAHPAFGQTANQAASPDDQTVASGKKTDSKRPKVSDARPTSPNSTINLVNLLVKQGVIKQDQADQLIKQAEDEAYVTRQASKDATVKADEAAKAASAAASAANPPGTKHVTYVPEVVKRELREEIKKEVMDKAEKENWASPGAYPEWAQRIHFYGDVRVRYQGNFFPKGNDQGDAVNFNTINSGSPYDISLGNGYVAPSYDAEKDRNQFRLRARLGMDADLTNGWDAGIRIATGQDNSPVSTNQTLGQNGGDFSKYSLWLDRGYIRYQNINQEIAVQLGRFDNPFWSPTDLVWYNELGFDGFAIQAKHQVNDWFTPFGVAGAFPIFNTALNLSTNLTEVAGGLTPPAEVPSYDKWLLGGQLGFGSRFDPETQFRLAVAYYDFEKVQGQVSSPCEVLSSVDVCDTDLTRPSFAQKGNTYMMLRTINADVNNGFGVINQFQYFGLLQKYRPLVTSAQIDFSQFNPYHIILDGEFVWNSAFDRSLTVAGTGPVGLLGITSPGVAINNRAGTPIPGIVGPFNGGDQGWMARVTVGNKDIKTFGDWNAYAAYKFLESDATLDAFVDPDFGLGGTNLKGYIIGANLGVSNNVWAALKWMSATNIGGTPYAVDVVQVDLNARF
jgi:hypothetical protein